AATPTSKSLTGLVPNTAVKEVLLNAELVTGAGNAIVVNHSPWAGSITNATGHLLGLTFANNATVNSPSGAVWLPMAGATRSTFSYGGFTLTANLSIVGWRIEWRE
ncbi:MAG: hypothetical protein ACREIB_01800, partial [Pseudomonadota bacterium]